MKTERIYRELLLCSLARVSISKQKDLAERCGVSLGLVNKTAKKLETAQALEVTRRGLRILSPGRILNLWATERKLGSEIVRAFRWDPVQEVGRELPRASLLTAFPAWYALTGRRPAEYSSLYFYVEDVGDFDRWFRFRERRARKTNPNVFVLRVDDPHLFSTSERGIVPVPQIYVDIYAIGGPEAPPYLRDIVQTYPELSLW